MLNVTKQFITSGKNGDVIIAFAVTDPAAGKSGILAFIVPTNAPGSVVTSVERKLGQHASDTCQIQFEDMRLSADSMLGAEGQGLNIARSTYEVALAYAKIRGSMGKPIIEHQAIGFRLAEMATRLETARQLYLHGADMRQNGMPCLK